MSVCSVCSYVFFFKQKTAYEMRISDWSSDVCSSDLCRLSRWSAKKPVLCAPAGSARNFTPCSVMIAGAEACVPALFQGLKSNDSCFCTCSSANAWKRQPGNCARSARSVEHTSELQSLMRISYAVFCLKIKNTDITHITHLNLHTHTSLLYIYPT